MRILIILTLSCVCLASADQRTSQFLTVNAAGAIAPTGLVATVSDFAELSGKIDPVSNQVASAFVSSTGAVAQASAAYDMIRFVGADNIVSSTAYIQSVGAQSSAGTNQVIRIHRITPRGSPVTNVYVVASFDKVQLISPKIDFRCLLTQGGTNTVWSSIQDAVCSWPDVVTDPAVTNAGYVYSFNVPMQASSTAFFRVISRDDGGSGSGYYFLIYNYIVVNGRIGMTADIEDDAGAPLHFEGGILAVPLED